MLAVLGKGGLKNCWKGNRAARLLPTLWFYLPWDLAAWSWSPFR